MEQPNALVKIALAEVVQKVNSGVSPTEALKKVADSLDLNSDYTHRVGEALNVALHYKHFKAASDRSENFMIADIPEVLNQRFNISEKSASERVDDTFSQGDGHDEVFNYNRMLSNPAYKKAYLEITKASETESYDSFTTSIKGVLDKSAKLFRDLEQTLDNCKTEKIGAEVELNQQFSKLADYFKRDENYRESFEEFESQVFSKHGEAAVPYLDLIYKTSGINEARGVHDQAYTMFEPCKASCAFDSLMHRADKLISAELKLKTAEENQSFEKSYYAEATKLMGKHASLVSGDSFEFKKKINFTKTAETEKVEEDPVLAQIANSSKAEKTAGILETLALSKLVGSQDYLDKGLEGLAGRAFSEKPNASAGVRANVTLDNMERQLLLQELLMTDAILSKAPAAKVARAYEQILRLSPQVAKEKEVVRAILRQAVAGQAIAPHEADQWTKLDLDIMRRKIVGNNYLQGRGDSIKF